MKWNIYTFGAQSRVMALVVSSVVINKTLEHVTVLPVVERTQGRNIYAHEAACVVQGPGGGGFEAIAMAHQIRTLRRAELGDKVGGILRAVDRRRVLDALEVQLGIQIVQSEDNNE